MCECFKRDYQLREEIGCGRFGVVFRCCTATAKGFFAVKSINKRRLLDSTDRECLEKEPKILHILSPHPNILQICNPYESDSHLLIVTELCESSNLYDRIALNVFEESEAAALIIPLVEAIAHCYRHGIVHMDIKPENILFDSRNSLKLIDFGSSKWFDAENISMRGVVGTPYCVSGGVEREGVQ